MRPWVSGTLHAVEWFIVEVVGGVVAIVVFLVLAAGAVVTVYGLAVWLDQLVRGVR